MIFERCSPCAGIWTLFLGVMLFCTPMTAAEMTGGMCESRRPLMEGGVTSEAWALLGVACFNDGKYVPALIYYRRAYSLSKSPVLLAALGRTLQELGLPGLAATYYKTYLKQNPDVGNRARISRRLEAVEAALQNSHRLRIQSDPPGAMVFLVLDGMHWEPLGPAPTAISVLSGRYVVAFQEPTHHWAIETIDIDGPSTMHTELVSHLALFNLTTRRMRRRAAYLGLAATPLLGGGLALLWMGRDNEERARTDLWQRPSEYSDRLELAYDQQNLGAGLMTTAATLGIVASTMVIFSYLWERESPSSVAVSPSGQLSIAF
jgi:tetratricopeptide (TPR) repeat protein